jgi:hypothetical protein
VRAGASLAERGRGERGGRDRGESETREHEVFPRLGKAVSAGRGRQVERKASTAARYRAGSGRSSSRWSPTFDDEQLGVRADAVGDRAGLVRVARRSADPASTSTRAAGGTAAAASIGDTLSKSGAPPGPRPQPG